uniref:Nance-Horan syndrome b (congenital cataracts and dental anomalies) n=1 Tax=Sphaeramia orbicularis TaxID=375764 RepID=A0A673AP63_9TELE
MPFAKRIVEPQLLCRHQIPNDEGLLFEDLCAISNVVLSRTLRQLSDLARHACSLFQELENDIINTNQRVWVLQNKIGQIQQTASALDPKKEAVPVSNLDIESKLSVHYQAPWHQQHNVFHPCTRPPCLEELHRNAQLSLRALHRGERRQSTSRERNRVTISISVAPPMPTFPSPHTIRRQQRSRLARAVTPICLCQATSTGDSDGGEVLGGHKAKASATNAPATQDKQTNWSKENQPAGDQKSTGDPNSISSCIIPINVTGVGFDREASARCSLVHSQSVLQRRRKLRRRKTITGIPKRVQQDMDSDESPVARERTVIVHANPHQLSLCQEDLSISGRLSHTRDSGCQTDDFLIASAPSRRRIRAQRGHQGIPASLSHSTGNISSLGDQSESTYTTAAAHGGRLRSRSLPREGGRLMDSDEDDDDNYDDDDEDEELSPYEAEDFIPPGPSGGGGSPEHSWMERGRSRLPRKADMGSCEISSSSDTFSSPIHSVSTTGVLGSHVDHKEDHQSSSGNWSGSSSTCPSQTSETIPPPSSPPLTGSSHCDSELSLNTVPNAIDEGFSLDPSYHSDLRPQGQGHRSSSFTSSATDQLDDAGVSTNMSQSHDLSQEYSPKQGLQDQSCFTDKTSNTEKDPVSHYPSDTEGFYFSSVHSGECNQSYRNYMYNYADQGPEFGQNNTVAAPLPHGVYPQPSAGFRAGTMTLGRPCRPLRKPKVKPPPPKRTSSLKESSSSVDVGTDTQADHDQPKMVSEQELSMSSTDMKLELELELEGGPEQLQTSCLVAEPLGTWGMGLRETVDIVEPMSFSSADTHSFKDEGAVQSDYADLWLHNNEMKSNNGEYTSMSNSSTATGTTVMECIKSPESSSSSTETQTQSLGQASENRPASPPLPPGDFKLGSPEKLAGLASPSSGYSSQSETPTSTLPSSSAAFFPGPLSPSTGKRKPKVPERKSSLSSLQHFPRDGASISSGYKRDPDFPPPPSQLDLSILHGGHARHTLSHRTHHMHTLHYSKHRVANVLNTVSAPSIPSSNLSPLHRPVPRAPHPSPVDLHTHIHSHTEFRGLTHSGHAHPEFRVLGERSFSQDDDDDEDDEEEEEEQVKEPPGLPVRAACSRVSMRPDHPPPPAYEFAGGYHSDSGPWASPVKVPGTIVETSQPYLISDARRGIQEEQGEEEEVTSGATRSAHQQQSQESKDDSTTPDTEDYFNSTPSDNSLSPLTDDTKVDDDIIITSPNKTRTTEDLFAMIHRSKRKVLGRKDSGDLNAKSRLCPPAPVTTGSVPAIAIPPAPPLNIPATLASAAGSQRAPVPIYRSAKKSNTSNEEFKLLLLKKGSRSDSSYRMSATEILKSPITPKTPGDSLHEGPIRPTDEIPSTLQESPLSGLEPIQIPGLFPRANSESFTPKTLPMSAASRQGRSRIPPVANSSRYSTRSRLYTAPMQAISEGETENSDGSPHDDRSS